MVSMRFASLFLDNSWATHSLLVWITPYFPKVIMQKVDVSSVNRDVNTQQLDRIRKYGFYPADLKLKE